MSNALLMSVMHACLPPLMVLVIMHTAGGSCAHGSPMPACRIGDPDYKMEQEVDAGKLGGSMYGTVEIPEEQRKPRHSTRWRQLVVATRRATRAFLTLA